jgi:hypothetical protein
VIDSHKNTKRRCVFVGLIFYLLVYSANVISGRSQNFGDYTVYYNAFTSDTLQPNMAKAYQVTRSKNRGVLSLSVLKKSLSPLGTPVDAKIIVKATNLTGQLRKFKIRQIKDHGAVYYISEFHVADQEVLDFELELRLKDKTEPFIVKFRQQFFTN